MTDGKRVDAHEDRSPKGRRWRGFRRRVAESGLDPVDLAGALWNLTVAGWQRTPRAIRRPATVLTRTFRAYSADNCNIYAAAIAYYALFSVVPLLIITLALLGLFVSEDRAVEFIYDQVPLEQSTDVTDTLSAVVRRTKNLSGPALAGGALALAWSASGVFMAMREGLNAVSHAKQGHHFLVGKVIDVALVPLLGAIVVLGLFANAATRVGLEALAQWEPLAPYEETFWRAAYLLGAAAISFGLFLVLYRFIPSSRPSWKQSSIGALVATVLFEALRNLASLLLASASFSGNAAIYAGLATALAFLYVVRVMASVLLVGAVFGRIAGGEPVTEPTGRTLPTKV